MGMKIFATQRIEVEVTDRDLAMALFQKIIAMLGGIDDGGCDWYTVGQDVYIGSKEWHVASNSNIATLVDAANILLYGKRLTLD
ncbi:MAG: hypothetical protein ACPLRH_02960 [Desulfotomaculales bacterium]